MSLKNWQSNGWLLSHKNSPQEVADLLAVADRDLKDARTPSLSQDWQLAIAYNAALQCATAALAACGYRAARESHHYHIIQSLALTIGADKRKVVNKLDQFRKKRNLMGYERAGVVTAKEVKEMLELARGLRRELERWLKSKYPELMPGG